MSVLRSGSAILALCVALLPEFAAADGLTKVGARTTIVDGALRIGSVRLSATPVPMAPGKFVVPFAGSDTAGGRAVKTARVQFVDSAFQKQGDPVTLFASDVDSCCASFAENGGLALTSPARRSEIVFPLYTVDTRGEVFGFFVDTAGASNQIGERLTRGKDENQSSPVVVPLKGSAGFVMWSDSFHETGESETSVRGAFVDASGRSTGPDILIENKNIGFQVPTDGVQLADGRLLLVWKANTASDVLGYTFFYGRIMRADGRFAGPSFLLGANNGNLFATEMRVTALPNGNFVATWIDDRSGQSFPFYRIFQANGLPTGPAQRFGALGQTGTRLDVAALADSRFVVIGTLVDATGMVFVAQLLSPDGTKLGAPLPLQTLRRPDAPGEHHIANAGYLIGMLPPTGGVATAPDPQRVFVTWRINQPGPSYSLYGQLLRASP
jgi:hypothetical protein